MHSMLTRRECTRKLAHAGRALLKAAFIVTVVVRIKCAGIDLQVQGQAGGDLHAA